MATSRLLYDVIWIQLAIKLIPDILDDELFSVSIKHHPKIIIKIYCGVSKGF